MGWFLNSEVGERTGSKRGRAPWAVFILDFSRSKIIKKLYKGNICLDLGSILGSVSLYSRSNKIIESGGLLVQSKQSDSSKIWGNLSKDLLFNNLSSLYKLLDNLLINKKISNELLDKSYFHFKEGKNNMNKVLIDIFKS